MRIRTEYMPLSALLPAPTNPKDHDLGVIHQSIDRFGIAEDPVLDERTGLLLHGHGRVEVYRQKQDSGEKPPPEVTVKKGEWWIPVRRGWASKNDEEAKAAAIALNRTAEAGGWTQDLLLDDLKILAEGPGLEGIGFDLEDLDRLMKDLEGGTEPPPQGHNQNQSPSNVMAAIGEYRFEILRDHYESWLEDLRQEVGFDKDSITQELRRRLGL